MGTKKIDIEFYDNTIVNNLNDKDLIAEISKNGKKLLKVFYVIDFADQAKDVIAAGDAAFAMYGVTRSGAKKIIVDDGFISLYTSNKVEICKGILAHEYGHYVDGLEGKEFTKDFKGNLMADVSADKRGAEATTKRTIINSLEYLKYYFESLNNEKYILTIGMLNYRLEKL